MSDNRVTKASTKQGPGVPGWQQAHVSELSLDRACAKLKKGLTAIILSAQIAKDSKKGGLLGKRARLAKTLKSLHSRGASKLYSEAEGGVMATHDEEYQKHRELMAAALLPFAMKSEVLMFVSVFRGDPVSTAFEMADILIKCNRTGALWSTATQKFEGGE